MNNPGWPEPITRDQEFYAAILAQLRAVNERLDRLLQDGPLGPAQEVELKEPAPKRRAK